ncbi:MAG: Na/Pi cotransporter family protein [Geobacteraceae bacterium]|nr:Na/Pi cotransporter family protein [Geobacteraceae bacterium]
MLLFQLLEALGGLGLFVFGMKTLADGLQRFASGRFRRLVEKLGGNRLSAALMGGCLSSLLQSSGAASVLIIGFVNAGLLSLYQALGMLVGTGLGTALAVQFIAFKISFLSLPAIFLGVVFRFFSRRRRWVFFGEILLGFGLLFFGLEIMESRLLPLGQAEILQGTHSFPFDMPIANVLIGALIAFLVQSGSAALGVILAVAGSGFIGFEQATAMALGEVMGTLALSAIGAIGGTLTAKRTVFFYGVISVSSVALVLLFFPFYLQLVSMVTPGYGGGASHVGSVFSLTPPQALSHTVTARAVANSYTLFSIFMALVFLPFIGFFARSAGKILPEKGDINIEPHPRFLDFRVVNTPTLAFLQAGNELKRMAQVAHSMVTDTLEQFYEFNAKKASLIQQKENLLDVLQKEISSFLVLLARQAPSSEKPLEIPVFLSTVNDLEGIGDNCEIILECLRRKKEDMVYFSETAMDELKSLAKDASYLMNLAVDALDSFDVPDAEAMKELKKALLTSEEKLKRNHLVRLSTGNCTVIAGLLFMEIIAAFTKIGDFSYSIIEMQRTLR